MITDKHFSLNALPKIIEEPFVRDTEILCNTEITKIQITFFSLSKTSMFASLDVNGIFYFEALTQDRLHIDTFHD